MLIDSIYSIPIINSVAFANLNVVLNNVINSEFKKLEKFKDRYNKIEEKLKQFGLNKEFYWDLSSDYLYLIDTEPILQKYKIKLFPNDACTYNECPSNDLDCQGCSENNKWMFIKLSYKELLELNIPV